jgi:hypothetical protein
VRIITIDRRDLIIFDEASRRTILAPRRRGASSLRSSAIPTTSTTTITPPPVLPLRSPKPKKQPKDDAVPETYDIKRRSEEHQREEQIQ